MNLVETIKADALVARKNHDNMTAQILTTLYSECAMVGKNLGRETTDSEAVAVVKRFANNLDSVLALELTPGQRQSAIDELVIITKYIPAQMTEARLSECINDIIAAMVDNNVTPTIGSVMKALKQDYSGQFDGKLASSIIQHQL